jgi:hypothetical protein
MHCGLPRGYIREGNLNSKNSQETLRDNQVKKFNTYRCNLIPAACYQDFFNAGVHINMGYSYPI